MRNRLQAIYYILRPGRPWHGAIGHRLKPCVSSRQPSAPQWPRPGRSGCGAWKQSATVLAALVSAVSRHRVRAHQCPRHRHHRHLHHLDRRVPIRWLPRGMAIQTWRGSCVVSSWNWSAVSKQNTALGTLTAIEARSSRTWGCLATGRGRARHAPTARKWTDVSAPPAARRWCPSRGAGSPACGAGQERAGHVRIFPLPQRCSLISLSYTSNDRMKHVCMERALMTDRECQQTNADRICCRRGTSGT